MGRRQQMQFTVGEKEKSGWWIETVDHWNRPDAEGTAGEGGPAAGHPQTSVDHKCDGDRAGRLGRSICTARIMLPVFTPTACVTEL